jgi:hypothetical protein
MKTEHGTEHGRLWPSPLLASIHPSDPWPLPGHPEAMKMELPPRLFSRQCLEVEFCELRHYGVLRSWLEVRRRHSAVVVPLLLRPREALAWHPRASWESA